MQKKRERVCKGDQRKSDQGRRPAAYAGRTMRRLRPQGKSGAFSFLVYSSTTQVLQAAARLAASPKAQPRKRYQRTWALVHQAMDLATRQLARREED